MPDDALRGIVTRMVEAGESEADIAAVIQRYKETAKPEGKSVGGFGKNLVTSGLKLIGDTAKGAVDAGKFVATEAGLLGPGAKAMQRTSVGEAMLNAPEIVKTAGGALKDRYGSLEAIGNTAYNDPAGMAADLSTILSLGAGAAARAPRLAGALRKAGTATNPLRAATKPVGEGLKGAANLTVRGTLRPSKAIRDDFGGAKGVADAVLKERVYSEANATKKLGKSVKDADDLIAAKEAAGVRGVPARKVADSLQGAPSGTAARRQKLGVQSAPKSVADRRQAILDENAIPGQPGATRLIPLTEAQGLKREAQDLAYEAAKSNLSLDQQSNSAIARALREGIEQRVPEVGPINERSQRLIGAQRAFADAQDRPRALTNFLSILGGTGGFVGGGGPGAAASAALIKAMDSPRLGAATGIALNEAGTALMNPGLLQAALLARLAAIPDE